MVTCNVIYRHTVGLICYNIAAIQFCMSCNTTNSVVIVLWFCDSCIYYDAFSGVLYCGSCNSVVIVLCCGSCNSVVMVCCAVGHVTLTML